jgi:beta-lactamase regulating signal transducer with metallopeptidase domain
MPAFTAGWLRPRVYVAESLGWLLSEDELAAVLTHEGAHVARRDPLRLSLLRFLGCTLFWIPALRRLAGDIADEGEVRADDVAASRHGLALASALVRLAAWPSAGSGAVAVGFTGGDLLERRVLRLTGERIAPKTRVTKLSLLGAGLALVLAWSSGMAVAHPMPMGHELHCEQRDRAAIFHLFCHAGTNECPHDAGDA